jgi:hypothetical protein
MIIATAQREVLLGPDDLSTQLEPAGSQTSGDDVAVQRRVPNIGDIPREQRIRLPPVGLIVIEHLALRELTHTEAKSPPPGRVVATPYGGSAIIR